MTILLQKGRTAGQLLRMYFSLLHYKNFNNTGINERQFNSSQRYYEANSSQRQQTMKLIRAKCMKLICPLGPRPSHGLKNLSLMNRTHLQRISRNLLYSTKTSLKLIPRGSHRYEVIEFPFLVPAYEGGWSVLFLAV